MAKVLEFKATNVRPFTSWLKKFASIDNSLLLEIDPTAEHFVAKTYNAEHSVIKYSKISFAESGLEISNKPAELDTKMIKMGLGHLPRLIKSIDHFLSGEFTLGFKFEEILGEPSFAGTDLQMKNASLKMNIKGTSLHIFKYISEGLFLTKISKVNPLVTFDFPSLQIEKLNSLCNLDNEYKFIDLKTIKEKLTARGKTFELTLADSGKAESAISIYKAQFDKLDLENYRVDMANEKLVFRSNDSDTITVISMVEKDAKYEESIAEF
jgi:hypothetical protein